MLCRGYEEPSNQRVRALRRVIPELPIAIGLHPWFANQDIEAIVSQITDVKPTAVGECKLDRSVRRGLLPVELQGCVFEQQLRLASDLDLPVTVHAFGLLGRFLPSHLVCRNSIQRERSRFSPTGGGSIHADPTELELESLNLGGLQNGACGRRSDLSAIIVAPAIDGPRLDSAGVSAACRDLGDVAHPNCRDRRQTGVDGAIAQLTRPVVAPTLRDIGAAAN